MFERYLAMDWSGAKAVSSPAIAVAAVSHNEKNVKLIKPSDSSMWSREKVADFIFSLAHKKQKTFIGIDANFGYAQEIVRKQFPHIQSVYELWAQIDTICKNEANFYAEAFWSQPKNKKYFWTQGKQPSHIKLPKRLTEIACAAQGFGHPESPFKLLGPKQVGKGGLAAMRLAHFLKQRIGSRIAFWPFCSRPELEKALIVVAEIYPRLFIKAAGLGNAKITNKRTLEALLSDYGSATPQQHFYSDHQTDALIAAAGMKNFLRTHQDYLGLCDDVRKRTNLEGWIFGVFYLLNRS